MAPLLALLLAATSVESAALADDGLRAYEEMDLDGARELLGKAQRVASSRERPRVELWLGIVELERGNEAVARRWVRSALHGNPSLAAPPSVSPKVRAIIDELRPAARSSPSTRLARRARPASEAPRLAASSPAPAADTSTTIAAASPSSSSPSPSPSISTPISPHGGPADQAAPSPIPAASPIAAASPELGQLPSALVLAGAGAGAVAVSALGGGVILGALAQGAADAAQKEARAVDASARYDEASATAWMANGLYAVGAVAAAVGVGCATIELAGVGE